MQRGTGAWQHPRTGARFSDRAQRGVAVGRDTIVWTAWGGIGGAAVLDERARVALYVVPQEGALWATVPLLRSLNQAVPCCTQQRLREGRCSALAQRVSAMGPGSRNVSSALAGPAVLALANCEVMLQAFAALSPQRRQADAQQQVSRLRVHPRPASWGCARDVCSAPFSATSAGFLCGAVRCPLSFCHSRRSRLLVLRAGCAHCLRTLADRCNGLVLLLLRAALPVRQCAA